MMTAMQIPITIINYH